MSWAPAQLKPIGVTNEQVCFLLCAPFICPKTTSLKLWRCPLDPDTAIWGTNLGSLSEPMKTLWAHLGQGAVAGEVRFVPQL